MLLIISSNEMARQVSLQWDKPEDSPITTASTVIVRVENPFGTKQDGSVKYVNVFDPDFPEHLVIPTAYEIGEGMVFKIDSYKLGITESDKPYYSFRDGVINFDIYVGGSNINVAGEEGDEFIVGTDLGEVLENYDSIIVDDQVYQLLKDKSTNAGTVLYLDRPLETDITSATVAVRDNLKVRNNFRTKCALGKMVPLLADSNYYRPSLDEKQVAIMKVLKNDVASRYLFDSRDYLGSEKLLLENLQIIKWLGL